MKILRWRTGPAAVMAAMLVAACGTGTTGPAGSSPSSGAAASGTPASVGPPPATSALVRQVDAAVKRATSVHVTATVTQGGSNVGLDLSLTRSNEEFGQITYRGQPVTVLVTRGHTYVKVAAGTLKSMGLPSAACVLMCGKYLELTAGQARGMTGDLGWSALVAAPGNSVPKRLHYVRTVTVDGQPAWQLTVSGKGAVDVAARGAPYPLQLAEGPNRLDFTQWNSATIPPPPPSSQVVNLSQLKHM